MTDQDAGRVYLYGVTRAGGPQVLELPPISGDGPVYTITRGALSAVVSDDPLPRYRVSRDNVRRHEAVVDAVMQARDVLPARLGVMDTREAVERRLLTERRDELAGLLERVRDRVELSLKVSWVDLQTAFRQVVAADRELRALRDRLARGASYDARVELGDRAAKALDEMRGRQADDLVKLLRPAVADVCRAGPISELMVLNAAFLVERGRAGEFESTIAALDDSRGSNMSFRLAGPLPPYNFVAIDMN